jgi:site-specific DNA-methyltransferase (adenine-specific)/site-specific DNA-methyltransferase (cytosine-N4-specific)
MHTDGTTEKRLRRACRNLGLALFRSRMTGGYAVLAADGVAVTGAAALTLDEAAGWLAEAGARQRQDIAARLAEDRGGYEIYLGDAETVLRGLPAEAFQTCITSPPYFQHRKYNVEGQIGQEETPDDYLARLGDAFAEVRRTLRNDGTLWVVVGDSYVSNPSTSTIPRALQGNGSGRFRIPSQHHVEARRGRPNRATALIRDGLPMKSLIGIPGRLAAELQSRGWIFRADIIWHKPTGLPANIRDRPASVCEHVLLFAKSPRYFYNAAEGCGKNLWSFPVSRFRGDHHAMMPAALAERCVTLGSPVGATILDPFAGLGTVGLAAIENSRNAVLVELNPDYAARIRRRLG